MYEIVWQYDETAPFERPQPASAADARELLLSGNKIFADFFAPHRAGSEVTRRTVQVSSQDVGMGGRPGVVPRQEPFAAFLSCADARVPVELIFGRQANDLFVVRVAGNVLGDECLGSLDYAVDQLGTVRLLGVLGHTGCGAVTAAVDAYLTPGAYLGIAANLPLEAIISSLMPPVRAAAHAIDTAYGAESRLLAGYHDALVETAVILNAALSAAVLNHVFHARLGQELEVVFGVYNLQNRTIGLPEFEGTDTGWRAGLYSPPGDQAGFEVLAARLAAGGLVAEILERWSGEA